MLNQRLFPRRSIAVVICYFGSNSAKLRLPAYLLVVAIENWIFKINFTTFHQTVIYDCYGFWGTGDRGTLFTPISLRSRFQMGRNGTFLRIIHVYHSAAILESVGNKGFVFALFLPVQPHTEWEVRRAKSFVWTMSDMGLLPAYIISLSLDVNK